MSCITCKKKRANFNYIDEKPLYCKTCKTDDMIDVKNKKCINCKTHQPIYNINGEAPLYCKNCKTDDMIDVKNKKCIKCNVKQCSFNYPNEKKGIYCADCSLNGMVNIISKKCIKCNVKECRFNYSNEKKGIYCAGCSLNGMVDIFSKKCIICNQHEPSFNLPNEKKPTYCKKCKTNDMVDINVRKGGYYSYDIHNSTKIISFNSIFYDNNNLFKIKKNLENEPQILWLESELLKSRINNQKVWFISHIFPGAGESTNEYNTIMKKIFYNFRDIIFFKTYSSTKFKKIWYKNS